MSKFGVCFLIAYVSCVLCGSLPESQDNPQSVFLLKDPPNHCGLFCLTALKPMLDHIALHQQVWSTCGAMKLNETHSKLDRIEGQQTSVKETLSKLETSLESREEAWKKDFESRLDRLESGQNRIENQLAAILNELSGVQRKKIIPPKFEQIGSRYFYIENSLEQSWTSAASTCRQMGGHLASIQDEKEYNAIKDKVESRSYWLGINDQIKEGQYISVASDRPASFLKWIPGKPTDTKGHYNCVIIHVFNNTGMVDLPCSLKLNFICQADNEI